MTHVRCAGAGFRPGNLSSHELGEDGRIAHGYLFTCPAGVIEVLARAGDRLEAPT